MFSIKTVTLLAAFVAAASATSFFVTDFVASDIRVPSESHAISFTVSNPTAVYEQGGNDPKNCTVSWSTTSPPSCYTQCSSVSYPWYTRITPGTYNGAYDFSVDVVEYFVYQNSVLNNATFPVAEGSAGYACSRGGQSTICTYSFADGYNATFDTTYGTSQPTDVC